MKLILLSIFIITVLALFFFLVQQNLREKNSLADDFFFNGKEKFDTETKDAEY